MTQAQLAQGNDPLLAVRDVSVVFGGIIALNGVSFDMKQAASLKDFRTEVLLPGVKINTAANDFAPISQLQLMKFKGEKWELFGDVISADVGG